ncbi:MAG: hypothetical protein IJ899_15435 [Blautia sp.]|nr:hypothetical protein [Blautia sp.]
MEEIDSYSASEACGQMLAHMGLSSKYEGYRCVLIIVQFFEDHKESRWDVKITKDLYPMAGRLVKKSANAVEHSIRVAIRVCWKTNPEAVCDLIRRKTDRQPTNAEFISHLLEQVLH